MDSVITNIFTLMSTAFTTVTANPFLSILLGMSVAGLVFGLVLSIFSRRAKRSRG